MHFICVPTEIELTYLCLPTQVKTMHVETNRIHLLNEISML